MNEIIKKFNEKFFSKSKDKIVWYDKQGVFNLDDTRVVTITINDLGVRDQFNGYEIEIINKMRGTIVSKFFRFENYLTFEHRSPRDKYYHVWSNGGTFDWYISRPIDTKEMTDKISQYINQFK